ncbi:MAG TPA: hypothetical protein VGQ31_09395 [Candidatus Limnocylindrales bacterium]|nr:hypothetical protein [Candidatus Limnocylindrales bacterium]
MASPVSGSISRKLGQPLVLQKRRPLPPAADDRRRIRRMAEARPVTDVVVERFIMVFVCRTFWRAVIAVLGDRLRGRGV